MKTLLIADVLSEKYNTLIFHRDRILSLLNIVLKNICDTSLYPSNFEINEFDRNIFFLKSDINPSTIYEREIGIDEVSEESFYYFKQFVKKYNFIVGYELQKLTIDILERCQKKYINIWLHPVRFMEDEIFMIQTNDNDILEKLKKIQIEDIQFLLHAKYVEIYIKNRFKPLNISDNSCVIFGQTSSDKTLRTNTCRLSLGYFKKDIEQLSNMFSTIYFQEHPLDKNNISNSFIYKLHNIKRVNANSYQLLCDSRIKLVASISSSIGVESYFFGKNAIFFNKPTCDIKDVKNTAHDTSIFSEEFWKYLLNNSDYKYKNYFSQKNIVRNILNAYYAYSIIK